MLGADAWPGLDAPLPDPANGRVHVRFLGRLMLRQHPYQTAELPGPVRPGQRGPDKRPPDPGMLLLEHRGYVHAVRATSQHDRQTGRQKKHRGAMVLPPGPTGVGKPPWSWPPKLAAVDVLHKAVYGFATGAVSDALATTPPPLARRSGGHGPEGSF